MGGITISDALIVIATFLGPVAAVQAQKWIERVREKSNRREYVFHTLMATRGTMLSPDHLRALNSITLVFQGEDDASKKVRSAWRAYFHNLREDISQASENQREVHFSRRKELFIDLLASMADERKFSYDRVSLMTEAYHPHGVEMAETEANAIRKELLALLEGKRKLSVRVESD
ncbi:DUF6680 family protein [Xanthomonas sacchari]|uniref:DUF6680 family protein n=1 Tax=Xanthomonas sacchari TaxID=56458 RepID=UPI00225880FE|nr:DUF6680 family protein [Xanthomonas sacchari]